MCKRISIDLGNSSVKAIAAGKRINFSSKVSTKFNANKEYFDYVEYNGKTTYIGTGELDRNFNKTEKEEFIAQVLFATAQLIDTNYTFIDLGLLLPVAQLSLKDKFIETFKGTQFKAIINGKERVFNFSKNVAVLPEGMTSFYTLPDTEGKDIVIVDIGNFTLNIAIFENGKLVANYTEPLGVFDFYRTIMEIEQSKGNKYSEEDISRMIKNKSELLKVNKDIYLGFLKDILNKVKPKCNLASYKSYFTGGGASLLKNYIGSLPIEIIEDSLFSNVVGLDKLCAKAWGE